MDSTQELFIDNGLGREKLAAVVNLETDTGLNSSLFDGALDSIHIFQGKS